MQDQAKDAEQDDEDAFGDDFDDFAEGGGGDDDDFGDFDEPEEAPSQPPPPSVLSDTTPEILAGLVSSLTTHLPPFLLLVLIYLIQHRLTDVLANSHP